MAPTNNDFLIIRIPFLFIITLRKTFVNSKGERQVAAKGLALEQWWPASSTYESSGSRFFSVGKLVPVLVRRFGVFVLIPHFTVVSYD